MQCSRCLGKLRVINVREDKVEREIYRQRVCENCGQKTFTLEMEVEENNRLKETWGSLDPRRKKEN